MEPESVQFWLGRMASSSQKSASLMSTPHSSGVKEYNIPFSGAEHVIRITHTACDRRLFDTTVSVIILLFILMKNCCLFLYF